MQKLVHIMSKGEAVRLGLKRYFTGFRCSKGHFSERYICGVCVECARIKRESQREKNNKYASRYRTNNPEKIKASNRKSTIRLKSLRANASMGDLRQDELKRDYTYDHKEGVFFKGGSMVGSVNPEGYIVVSVGMFRYLAHRLAWFYFYGTWPDNIDHINGIRDDNRIENLRSVSKAENSRNQGIRSDNKSGFTGVSFSEVVGKWHVQISSNKRKINIGFYDSLIDAVSARIKANVRYGFHENHGDRIRALPKNT